MTSLREVKAFGGIGAILSVLVFTPGVGVFCSIIGLVLILIAVKYISDIYNEPKIFRNIIIAIILFIVSIVAFFFVFFSTVVGCLLVAGQQPSGTSGLGVILGVVTGVAALWACLVLGGVFIKNSYERISVLTGVDLFKTIGLLYLIGVLLLIVLIGVAVLFVAKILEAVAFFSIPEEYEKRPYSLQQFTSK